MTFRGKENFPQNQIFKRKHISINRFFWLFKRTMTVFRKLGCLVFVNLSKRSMKKCSTRKRVFESFVDPQDLIGFMALASYWSTIFKTILICFNKRERKQILLSQFCLEFCNLKIRFSKIKNFWRKNLSLQNGDNFSRRWRSRAWIEESSTS